MDEELNNKVETKVWNKGVRREEAEELSILKNFAAALKGRNR